MHLHSEGQKDYIKELKIQRDKEIKEVRNSQESDSNKVSLIKKIILKFFKLIKDSDESLFIRKV